MAKKNINIISQLILYPFIIVCLVLLLNRAGTLDSTHHKISKQATYDVIQQYLMQCYATEGSYPNDLKYLEDNYGLILDRDNYIFEYHVFASNLFPEVYIHENIRKNADDE